MSDYIISCCSTADLTKEQLEKRDIKYVCFHFEMDGEQYADDLGVSIPFPEFYDRMTGGADTRTSQVNVDEYIEFFRPFLNEGKDIIHITLSSGISGTFNSAIIARNELADEYPDRKIIVIDSLCASGGFGLLADKMADLRDEGKTIDEVAQWVEENKGRVQHWFFTSDLTFFIKGGRVTKTAGFVGTALKICPLLNVNSEGALIPREKIRTKKKVIQAAVEKMKDHAEDGVGYNQKVIITHSHCYEDALAEAELVKEVFPDIDGEIIINYIGTTIGSHTGPGTVALFFWGDEREL